MTAVAYRPRADAPAIATPARARAVALVVRLHDELTHLFARLDGGGAFEEARWERPGGGGGVSRLLAEGATFEKAGINRSVVEGRLPREAALRLGARATEGKDAMFFATGVSLVVHPRSPLIPTLHLNVRYFEVTDASGAPGDAWVGGGTDLTPMHPQPEDARLFHRTLKTRCDAHHDSLYPRFKGECDEYFANHHRGHEARGVGGIFFDRVRAHEDASLLDLDGLLAFLWSVGISPEATYAPIVERRRHATWGTAERELQLARRGRYVEFNLLHDRGTLFGLQTGARVESVLMSLPPLASWAPPHDVEPGSAEGRLLEMLAPHDWAGDA